MIEDVNTRRVRIQRPRRAAFIASPLYFGLINILIFLAVLSTPTLLYVLINSEFQDSSVLGVSTTLGKGVRIRVHERIETLRARHAQTKSNVLRLEIDRLEKSN